MGWSSMSFKRSGENICWCSMSICVCVFFSRFVNPISSQCIMESISLLLLLLKTGIGN